MAEAGDLGPLWIRADIQTAGRGRRGRDWNSAKGNLFCTGLYPHFGDAQNAAMQSFVAALAVYDLVKIYVPGSNVGLKWPNDVMIDGQKISGILLESGGAEGCKWIGVGIGINLMSHPSGTETPATHIIAHIPEEDLSGPEPIMTGPDAALAVLAERFDHWRHIFLTEGFTPIRKAWMDCAYNIPGPVRVRLPAETFYGEALGLGDNGELRVRLQDGNIRDVHAGDVFF
jgi:BirA family biotin operon repressor/biotin-[acetyl-CoA-carboxylase] ligase